MAKFQLNPSSSPIDACPNPECLTKSKVGEGMKDAGANAGAQQIGGNKEPAALILVETIQDIQTDFGDDAMGFTQIKEWYNQFKDGRTPVVSEPPSGRPSTIQNDQVIAKVNAIVIRDRRVTIREIAKKWTSALSGTFHSDRSLAIKSVDEIRAEVADGEAKATWVAEWTRHLPVPPGVPTILGPPLPLVVGQLARLKCVSQGGHPPPSLRWFKGEREIHAPVHATPSGVSSELVVRAEAEDNGASYRCEAYNEASKEPAKTFFHPVVHCLAVRRRPLFRSNEVESVAKAIIYKNQLGLELGNANHVIDLPALWEIILEVETIQDIKTDFGDDAIGFTQIKEWYNRFKDGRTSVDSEPRSGQPSTIQNDQVIAKVKAIVMRDHSVTIREIAE
ncbi:NPHS1 [Cordylochernes scorpioides]|uniref:NPHS1 n=1 Tax=Cordylochernes scorpioides TaxID=51811 RepID=A0ABY6LS46_9ARAC|nr:NPHS1 [Cordylochernes scorpioides]